MLCELSLPTEVGRLSLCMAATLTIPSQIQPSLSASKVYRGAAFLAVFIAVCYVFRGTVVVYNAGEVLSRPLAAISAAAIVAAAIYVMLGGVGQPNFFGLLLLGATGASLLHCDRFDFAWPRWLGWVLLVWSIGPITLTRFHIQFRGALFRHLNRLFLWCTIASFAWWLLGLPNLGRGTYYHTGVMWQSTLLAPIAAIVAVRALCNAVFKNSHRSYVIFLIGLMTCTLAASRAALAALGAAIAAILIVRLKRDPIVAMAAALPIAAFAGFLALPMLLGDSSSSHISASLQRKGLVHSREGHWQDRLDEFRSSPWLGVGFASAWEATKGFDENSGAVETGSSYIAMLSMTGLSGIIAFGLLMSNLLRRFWVQRTRLTQEVHLQVAGMTAFWLVHLGAEGYIYASGSVLGLSFWSWMGCVHDVVHHSESSSKLAEPQVRNTVVRPVPLHRPYVRPKWQRKAS